MLPSRFITEPNPERGWVLGAGAKDLRLYRQAAAYSRRTDDRSRRRRTCGSGEVSATVRTRIAHRPHTAGVTKDPSRPPLEPTPAQDESARGDRSERGRHDPGDGQSGREPADHLDDQLTAHVLGREAVPDPVA